MNKFHQLPEFEKEVKKLSRKYPSIRDDIEDIKPILLTSPTGIGKNFTIITTVADIRIVKVRIHCESLRSRSIRLIYAYRGDKIDFIFIELYFKGDKVNEDHDRIAQYLRSLE
jgi:hypothetical protein